MAVRLGCIREWGAGTVPEVGLDGWSEGTGVGRYVHPKVCVTGAKASAAEVTETLAVAVQQLTLYCMYCTLV